MKIKQVNIGLSIEHRLNELGISKSEFGRKIGIPQQNVNRILTRDSIDTDKLITISEALDFNFFDYFRSDSTATVSPVYSASPNQGTPDTAVLEERIKNLEALLSEKERLIKVLLDMRK